MCARQRQPGAVVVIPALGVFMLEVEVNGNESLAGRDADQRFGMFRPPFMDNVRISACVFESVQRQRFFIGGTGEDANPLPRQL
jgi:hypothetical protein